VARRAIDPVTGLLVPTIADALRFSFHSQEDPRVQLLNYLKEKEMLLVLDKFEGVVEGAGLLGELLQQAPRVRIIVTSQERLNLREEWVVEVGGLEYPAAGKVDGCEGYSAVQLFLQGAQRVNPAFSLQEADKPWVVRICELTGGIPLGIELASAWARMLSCREIAQEIEKSLDFLGGSMRDGSRDTGSLRAVFEHSWNILSAEEKEVFGRTSVFRGSLRREAAEKVVGDSLPPLVLLTILSSLVDKSLLRRNASGRYEMLEVVRQYAEGKLGELPGEKARVRDLHCAYYAGFLGERQAQLRGAGQDSALAQIGEEIENVRHGWAWAVEGGRREEIEKMLDSLYQFYEAKSWLQEGVEALERAAKALGGTSEPSTARRGGSVGH
jgi:predicted ATPase